MSAKKSNSIDHLILGIIILIGGGIFIVLGVSVGFYLILSTLNAHGNITIGLLACSGPFLVIGVILLILGIMEAQNKSVRSMIIAILWAILTFLLIGIIVLGISMISNDDDSTVNSSSPTKTLQLTITAKPSNTYQPTDTPTLTYTPLPTHTPAPTSTITLTPTTRNTVNFTEILRYTVTRRPSSTPVFLSEKEINCPSGLANLLGEGSTSLRCYEINSEWKAYGLVYYYSNIVVGIGATYIINSPSYVVDDSAEFVGKAGTTFKWNVEDLLYALAYVRYLDENQWSTYGDISALYRVLNYETFVILFYRPP